jgi:hypothetical protein
MQHLKVDSRRTKRLFNQSAFYCSNDC